MSVISFADARRRLEMGEQQKYDEALKRARRYVLGMTLTSHNGGAANRDLAASGALGEISPPSTGR